MTLSRNKLEEILAQKEKVLYALHNDKSIGKGLGHMLHYVQVITKGKVEMLQELKRDYFQPKARVKKKVTIEKEIRIQKIKSEMELLNRQTDDSGLKIIGHLVSCNVTGPKIRICMNDQESCTSKKCERYIEYLETFARIQVLEKELDETI